MATVNVNFRLDEEVKRAMEEACADMGLSMTTAFTIFAKKVGRERRIPFEVAAPKTDPALESGRQAFWALRKQAEQNGVQDLSPEEINEEIRLTREEKGQMA